MARPATSLFTEQVYAELLPLAEGDEAAGWPLLHYVEGAGSTVADIEYMVRDTDEGPGWSPAVSIARAPARILDWLAQLNGVRPAKGLSEADYRTYIGDAANRRRGTRGALIAAAQLHLSGTRSVRLLERDTSPYHLTMIVRPSEVPPWDLGATWGDFPGTWDDAPGTWDATLTHVVRDAVLAVLPAGLVLTFLISDAVIIDEGTRTIDAGTATIDTATLSDVT